MTKIDHDAIAARVRQDRETGTPGPWKEFIDDSGDQWTGWPLSIDCTSITDKTIVRTGGQWPYEWDAKTSRIEACANARRIAALPDLEAAYLDLYDEVKRLRADLAGGSFYKEADVDRLMARAEKAEAERDVLRVALTNGVNAYDATNFMRTADMHPDECGCLRCALDAARAALKGTSE